MQLEKNKRYRADIQLGFVESFATNATITDKLTDAGFTSVTVWGQGRIRHAEGIWTGDSAQVELPEQVKNVVEVQPA